MRRLFLLLALVAGCGRTELTADDGDGGAKAPDLSILGSDMPPHLPPDIGFPPMFDIAIPSGDIGFVTHDIAIGPPPDVSFGGSDIGFVTNDIAVGVPDAATPPDLVVIGPCGDPGLACCANNTCNAGGCCSNAVCVSSGASCGNGEVCANSSCVACGGVGAVCCQNNSCDNNGCCGNNRTCVAPNADCGGGFGICTNQGCVSKNNACGGDGQQCCVTPNPFPNICTSPGTVCGGGNLPGLCVPCGGAGQNCCEANACDGGGCCVNNTCHSNGTLCGQTMCANGSCGGGTCGAVGQPCCGMGFGATCTAPGTRCVGGMCQPCGGLNQRCCRDPNSMLNIVCDAPFQPSGLMMCMCTH